MGATPTAICASCTSRRGSIASVEKLPVVKPRPAPGERESPDEHAKSAGSVRFGDTNDAVTAACREDVTVFMAPWSGSGEFS